MTDLLGGCQGHTATHDPPARMGPHAEVGPAHGWIRLVMLSLLGSLLLLSPLLASRAPWKRRLISCGTRMSLRAVGTRLEIHVPHAGEPRFRKITAGTLIASNHISWVDVAGSVGGVPDHASSKADVAE